MKNSKTLSWKIWTWSELHELKLRLCGLLYSRHIYTYQYCIGVFSNLEIRGYQADDDCLIFSFHVVKFWVLTWQKHFLIIFTWPTTIYRGRGNVCSSYLNTDKRAELFSRKTIALFLWNRHGTVQHEWRLKIAPRLERLLFLVWSSRLNVYKIRHRSLPFSAIENYFNKLFGLMRPSHLAYLR